MSARRMKQMWGLVQEWDAPETRVWYQNNTIHNTSVLARPRLLLFTCSEAQSRHGNTENSTCDQRFEHCLKLNCSVGLMGETVFILSTKTVRKLLESLYNRRIVSQYSVNNTVKREVFTSGSSMCLRAICPQKNVKLQMFLRQSTRTASSLRREKSCIIAQHSIELKLEVISDS